MAVPKRRTTRSRRDMRRSHHALRTPSQSACPRCHEPRLPHRVCRNCGSYRGREVIRTDEE